MEKKAVLIRLPEELIKLLKHEAINRGTSMSVLVEEVVRKYLGEK